MKRISIALLAAILVVTVAFKASAQTEQTRQVSGFNGIGSAGSFNVHVKIDGTESLKLSAPADIINDIETVVEGGKLEIRFKRDSERRDRRSDADHGKIDVYVTAKALSSLSIAGSGYIKVDGVLSSNDVKLTISGSGDITSAVKSTSLHATISGSGTINVDGNSESANFTVSGSGEMKAKGLKADVATVILAGSGNAHIYADKTITAHVAGSGNVIYSGNASVTDIRMAGSGNITKEKS